MTNFPLVRLMRVPSISVISAKLYFPTNKQPKHYKYTLIGCYEVIQDHHNANGDVPNSYTYNVLFTP